MTAQDPSLRPSRLAWLRDQWAFVLVLVVAVAGLVVVAARSFRPGCLLLGAALVLGAVLRAVLPGDRAGMLRLRSRLVDVLVLGGLGGLTCALALAVPSLR